MTDLKNVIVVAFKEANLRPDYGSMELVGRPCLGAQSVIGTRTVSNGYLGHAFDLDRLAQAITDHVLDREKVSALLADLTSNFDLDNDQGFNTVVDRLIEGLAGKAGEQ